jgi:hypothetical protein
MKVDEVVLNKYSCGVFCAGTNTHDRSGDVAQVIERLSSKCTVLSSNSSSGQTNS